MSEGDVIARTGASPATVASLTDDLEKLGVRPGSLLLVHSSLSALGWVAGGPVAVIQALLACLGETGTLVMPAYSGEYSDPEDWENPPVPDDWKPVIREHMPAFERNVTPSRGVGAIAECFRTWPGTVRSDHPITSFSARGPLAREICADHELASSVGEGSPLARVFERDGSVLLLGVGFGRNSSFHLAEYRADFEGKRPLENGSPLRIDGRRVWHTYKDLDLWGGDFRRIGAAFQDAEAGHVRTGAVACATAHLFPQRRVVDFAARWMAWHRTGDWRG